MRFSFQKKHKTATWKNKNSERQQQLNNWKETSSSFERNIPPHEIFVLFLRDEGMERICLESINHAHLKVKHNFAMTLDKLKTFIAGLLVSGCTELPRQEMYWERRGDVHNLLVSSMMGKNEFGECKKYLRLSDNNNLDMADRFDKVRPLLNSINQQCLLNYQPAQHISVYESIMPHFGRHGAKQYIHGKPIKFGYRFWVVEAPLDYCIQLCLYTGKDTILQEHADIGLGLSASVVTYIVNI